MQVVGDHMPVSCRINAATMLVNNDPPQFLPCTRHPHRKGGVVGQHPWLAGTRIADFVIGAVVIDRARRTLGFCRLREADNQTPAHYDCAKNGVHGIKGAKWTTE